MNVRILSLTALMLLAFAIPTFAQALFTVSSIPVVAAASTGRTEPAGDIAFTMVPGSPSPMQGAITLSYGVPISVPPEQISVTGTGSFSGKVSIATLDNASGILIINVPGGISSDGSPSIRVSGVRLALAGSGLASVNASISSTENAIVAGQTQAMVIASVRPGISSVGTSPSMIDSNTDFVLTQPVASVNPEGVQIGATKNLAIKAKSTAVDQTHHFDGGES